MCTARMNLAHLDGHLPDVEVDNMVDPLLTACQLLTAELILCIRVAQHASQSIQVVLLDCVRDLTDMQRLKFRVVEAL